MSNRPELPEPSGNAWLIPVAIDPGPPPGEWRPGPAAFALAPEVREVMKGHLQGSAGVIDAVERHRSWTASSAELLVPADPSRENADTRRWHRFASSESLRGFSVACIELWTAPAADLTKSDRHLGVIIVHLAAGTDLAGGEETRDAFYASVRTSEGRKALLHDLADMIHQPRTWFHLPGAREQVPTVYVVTTVTELREDIDEDLLLAREIATLTPSDSHGTKTADARRKRIERARSGLTRLSDSWVAMVTGHGTAFLGSFGEDFVAARTYVSTIYVDAMAAVILSESIVMQLSEEIRSTVGELREERTAQGVLSTTMALRARLLWLRSTLLRIPESESRPSMLLSMQLAENLRLPSQLAGVEEDIASLMEVASLHHQLAQEKHQRQQEEYQRVQEASSKRVDTMLAILTVVALPLTMAYSGIDLVGGGNKSANPWYWIFSVLAAALALGFIWRTHRKRV